MKNISKILFAVWIFSMLSVSCKKSDLNDIIPEDAIGKSISPVTQLKVVATAEENEFEISWTNPDDESLMKVEITYTSKDVTTNWTPNPILVNVTKGVGSTLKIKVPTDAKFFITAVAINKAGVRSLKEVIQVTPPNQSTVDEDFAPVFLKRADTLMTALVKLYLDGKPRDIWSSEYPQGGGYWDGAAVIWGHGAAFSGYAALKDAAKGVSGYETKYEGLYDNRLLKGIDQFRNRKNGKAEAYAVYPGDGDERYYDDNIWVGIDMVDLYMLTNNSKYLDRAKLVWKFILEGTDDIMGGGVYWIESEITKSKHTCSSAPAAVLAAKLYQATKDETYLKSAKDLYAWCKEMLQDPSDYLYWDNVRLSDQGDPNSSVIVSKEKYSYNSGQPIQAASLLYTITGERRYLTDAQNVAKAAYKKWFVPFNSYTLGESFQILEPGHVWFQAVMFRGMIELYKLDGDRTYVTAYEKTLSNAWLSNGRDRRTNLLNGDFRGGVSQSKWEILHQGASLEMLARLAALERDGM